jgi:hypothetical protein
MIGGKLGEGGHFGSDSFDECSDFSGDCCVCVCGKNGSIMAKSARSELLLSARRRRHCR